MAEPTAKERRTLARMKIAMPDGSFYIRNAIELDDAIHAVGRATPNGNESEDARRNAVRRHIIARANALKLSSKIPGTWNSDGSLKHTSVEEILAHFGVKGMHWGVRRSRSGGLTNHPVSADAARARASQLTVRRHGTSALSNAELQHLVNRLNLEQQHGRLNPKQVSVGRRFVNETLKVGGDVAKQEATKFVAKNAAKGVEELLKRAAKG